MSDTERWSIPPEYRPDPANAGFDVERIGRHGLRLGIVNVDLIYLLPLA